MSVGTIVADATMLVKMMNGRNVGSIEESFITRLRKGIPLCSAGACWNWSASTR